ncbi:glycoside hydrolase domain-containing protein [Thomasclavelia cocleata]|jgi:peptidoglycan hydrolase-like protein with peptidoglycan-binding domain|uniref:glycoside hydrolase domain-containing protein n=3 Tax=Thomasclavelia cocleata TaxID=69824 RepID=UPI002420205F|nr:glycoside hydrolase domain-containing protein [Thomasclavelia cocleata]
MDAMVLKVQEWLNDTYGQDSRFNRVTEDGITGWGTIYGLRRALQIEEGITSTSNSFGPSTYNKCPNINEGDTGNLVYIVQGGLWCKGFNPGGFNGNYGSGTASAVQRFKDATGIGGNGNMNKDFMKALLDMSAFSLISNGKENIRKVQQQLNRDYYTYYQIGPCDGLYNRDMNKMLIYALQKELGIAKASATGTWGPTTVSKCKEKTYNVGDSDNIIKLIRYALVCNGYSVSISSTTYDAEINSYCNSFARMMEINKKENSIGYGVIRSLLSSNGDGDRSAIGCDTATKLTVAQIQTIKNNGYQFVGRYISNTPGGTLDKALTTSEISNILNAGLKLFLIFQESGNGASHFDRTTGLNNGTTALSAVTNLGYTKGAIVYFAVDFDATDSQIKNNIIPYFSGVIENFTKNSDKYRVGVYGTRNVCNSLLNKYPTIKNVFVSDASYGFSGNLGFTMPNNWSFDQFKTDITIGSGTGAVSIDKVAVSGVDNCSYTPNSAIEDSVVLSVSEEDKKMKGELMVNRSNNGLRVYKKARYSELYGRQWCMPYEQISTIPRDSMYVLMKDMVNEYTYRYNVSVVKFLDEHNLETYGYVVRDYGEDIPGTITNPELLKDVKTFNDQQNFENFTVSEDGNSLVSAQREEIEGKICSIYSLRYETKVYHSDGSYLFTLQPGRRIAIIGRNTGSTNNKLLAIFRMYTDGKWVKPGGFDTTSFIEYQLDKGTMPNNRLLTRI